MPEFLDDGFGDGLGDDLLSTPESAGAPAPTYFAPGAYRICYVNGAYQYDPRGYTNGRGYTVNSDFAVMDPAYEGLPGGFYVTDGNGNTVPAPGNANLYASQSACQSGNAGSSIIYQHNGGNIGIFLSDFPLWDNVPGSPSPTFTISGPGPAITFAPGLNKIGGQPDGLCEEWLFNQTSGATAPARVSSPADDLTISGAYAWGADLNGNYLELGSTAAIASSTASLSAFSETGDFSLECLFYDPGTVASLSGGFSGLISVQTGSGNDNGFQLYRHEVSGVGYYFFEVVNRANSGNILQGSTPYSTGVHHLVGSYQSSTQLMTLYLDGVSIGSMTMAGGTRSSGCEIFAVGNINGGIIQHPFEGPIYYAGVYAHAFTAQEAATRNYAVTSDLYGPFPQGSGVALAWNVANSPASISISPTLGSVSASGTATVNPTTTTTYVLTATSPTPPDITVTAELTVFIGFPSRVRYLQGYGNCSGEILLSWGASQFASAYKIERSPTLGENWTTIATQSETTYSDTPPSALTLYDYRVTATDGLNWGAPAILIGVIAGAVPSAPANLVAVALNQRVVLSADVAAGATSYSVYRGYASGTETLLVSGLAGPSYTDTNLTDGVTYYYKMTASTRCGESSLSSEVSATPLASLQEFASPNAPSNLWT